MAARRSAEDTPATHAAHSGLTVDWPWLLVAAAWAVAVVAALTGQRYLIDHHFLLEESGLSWPVAALVFLACWQVMIAAMMLPASMPTFTLMIGATRAQPGALLARGAFYAGYAAMWTVFALLAFAGDTTLHHAVDASPWLGAHAFLIGAATLAGAGAYQFSGLKSRCLAACHNSWTVFARSNQARSGAAWRLGARHGLASVGCCWGLMLIMFGLGVGGLGWMAALTGAMVIEAFPRYGWARRALGGALLLLALLWLAHPAWLVPAGAA
jgi:predicted metal-binding membrane protein